MDMLALQYYVQMEIYGYQIMVFTINTNNKKTKMYENKNQVLLPDMTFINREKFDKI